MLQRWNDQVVQFSSSVIQQRSPKRRSVQELQIALRESKIISHMSSTVVLLFHVQTHSISNLGTRVHVVISLTEKSPERQSYEEYFFSDAIDKTELLRRSKALKRC